MMKPHKSFWALSSLALACAAPHSPAKPPTVMIDFQAEGGAQRPQFPKHWGDPPRIQTRDLVDLPAPYGRGSSTLRKWILENQKKDQAKPQKPSKPKPQTYPGHWGDPPKIQTRDLVDLPAPYGKGSSTLRKWILENQKKDQAKPQNPSKPKPQVFPKHWGDPPQIQTADFVDLPAPYGKGSSSLKNWILEKQKEDQSKAKAAPKRQRLVLPAADIPAKGGFYLDKGKWLAINPDKNQSAQTSSIFPYPEGTYHLTLLGVGENDGEATHEILNNDESVLKFQIPLSTESFETGKKFNKTVRKLHFEQGDVITIKSKVASADGKEYSRARLAGLVFIPADEATRTAVAKMEVKPAPETEAKGPDLQQPRQPDGDGTITITGENTQWQPVTLSIDGPFAHELDMKPNPFLDFAFMVTFTHSSGSPEYHVPGYFAADGNAGESSAQSGTTWRAHFSPDKPGKWTYHTSFLTGKEVAITTAAGFSSKQFEILKKFTGSGEIEIKDTPENAPGFYREGRLTYVGKPYLQFAGSKKYFLKAGADAPETLLGYADFDDTTVSTKKVPLKHYKPHLKDWKQGDPTWKNGKGKGLIGALNYLSGTGANAFSFLPYNAGGDGDNVWPFVSRNRKFHYDCSKLDQWDIVFAHGQAKGLFLHFKLQETEMDDNNRGHGKKAQQATVPTSLDGGDLGPERKLYLRELVARFGHHLALNWNLGEENTQSTEQQVAMANYLRAVDPYDHHLVIHTFPDQQDKVYKPLLGADAFTGVSLQNSHLKDVHWQTIKWRSESEKAGKPWCIGFDEPGDAQYGMPPDPDYPGMPKDFKGPTVDLTRQHVLWGNLMGGGWGVEYYFGYKLPQNDLVCEDWRSRDQSWKYAKIALDFFSKNEIPFWEMTPGDELVGNPKHENTAYCLAKKGLYLVYLPHGDDATLTLPDGESATSIQWFNPRDGSLKYETKWETAPKINCPPGGDWLAIIKSR